MQYRSSYSALLSGALVLACSWPLLAQPSASTNPAYPADSSVESPNESNPIERLPAAPGSPESQTKPTAVPSPAPLATPTVPTIVTEQEPQIPDSTTPDSPLRPHTESLRALAQRLNLPLPLPKGRIVVLKSQRRLDLYNGDTLVKSYRVALGENPYGHKQRQGDGRTPEGQFYICTRNARTSSFHIFLGLSYPALPDATRAVKNKTITPREFNAIRGRLASRGAPLWETRLGGWVGIHGGSDGKFARKRATERGRPDWTAGCIAVTNREIEEIYAATKMGISVVVRP